MAQRARRFAWRPVAKRLGDSFLLLLLLACLIFAQIIVAFSQWYDWPLPWLQPLYKLACIIPLFCQLLFVRYIFLALLALVIGALAFALLSRKHRDAPLVRPAVASLAEGNWQLSPLAAALLGAGAGLEAAVLWFVAQRMLPPVLLWALPLLLVGLGLKCCEWQGRRPGLLSLQDWLFVLAFYSLTFGSAFLGSHAYLPMALIWLIGGVALYFSLRLGARETSQEPLWDSRDKLALVLLGLICFALGAYNINSWRYTVIGDDWGFYAIASHLLEGTVKRHFLSFHGQYGMHPIFSSYIHVASMRLWGHNNYGWRINNVLWVTWSALSLYLAVRAISTRRLALLSTAFYAFSHYLLSFSKIGYNNLQALWPVLTSLALLLLALRRGTVYGAWLAGVVTGFGFYVFAIARLVTPLLILLLLLYCLPTQRRRWLLWIALIGAVLAVALPILMEAGTSQVLWSQTVFSRYAGDWGALLRQVRDNTLYSLLSFLTSRANSHYVYGPHLDPLSASYVVLGFVVLLIARRPARESRLFLLLHLAAILAVGGLAQHGYPPNTRMFIFIPFYALLAAVGCERLGTVVAHLSGWRQLRLLWPLASLAIVLGLNIYIASYVVMHRRPLIQECLLFRMLQEMERGERENMPVYVLKPAGDHYSPMEYLLQAYGLDHVQLGVISAEEMVGLFRARQCNGGPTVFLIPSEVRDRQPLYQAAIRGCPTSSLTPLRDEAGAYHYEQIVAPVTVPDYVGYRITPWKP